VTDTIKLDFDPDALREKYREERDKRLRTDGNNQYIEVTGVPDGLYDVVSTANPDGGILEERGLAGGRGDDTARTRICLKGNTVKVMASGAKASAGCR